MWSTAKTFIRGKNMQKKLPQKSNINLIEPSNQPIYRKLKDSCYLEEKQQHTWTVYSKAETSSCQRRYI